MVQEKSLEQARRIQVERTVEGQVKVLVENHDPHLGWYTSASLTLPLHQLPLLEQAIQEMRRSAQPCDPSDKIIPFPG